MPTTQTSILLAGATGLVGSHALREFLRDDSVHTVHTLSRKPITLSDSKLASHLIDFDMIDSWYEVPHVSSVVSCLGTTIRAAGSQRAFRRVDLEYVVALGRLAIRLGARQFILVSSMGADSRSRVFYSRTKGEAEDQLRALGLPSLHILRPSLLLGNRAESRPGEEIGAVVMRALNPVLVGRLRSYRAIRTADVARAIVAITHTDLPGTHIHDSARIQHIADTGSL